MALYAGVECTTKQIRGTIALLRYFREFLNSDCERCVDPTSGWQRRELDKTQARARRDWLIDVAINRRAGLSDNRFSRMQFNRETDWIRDKRSLLEIRGRVRIYQFNSKQCRARFSHLLSRYDD